MKLVKTYNIGKAKTFDLSVLKDDLPPSVYTVKVEAVAKNAAESDESTAIQYSTIPSIWIKFKFLDPTYNPKTHNLAVGTAESNGSNRDFKAAWYLVDAAENIWMWGVTEGTNLSLAFRYGNGETSFPLLVASDYLTGISDDMWKLEGYSSKEAIIADTKSWWTDEVEAGHVSLTGNVEIIDWDLDNATSLDNLLGDNPYWRTAIVGTIPALTNSHATHAVYLFGRLYDVTSVGTIRLTGIYGDIQKVMFAMTSLEALPSITLSGHIQSLDRLFWQCCNVSKSSIETTYNYLNTQYGSLGHNSTFAQCGIYTDPTALDNIPASWGGNA